LIVPFCELDAMAIVTDTAELPSGVDAKEAADWTLLARILPNVDGTVTKN